MQDRIAALRARVAALAPDEREAFRVKVEAAGIDWARVAPASSAPRPDRLPLSPGQMQFWLTQQLQPDGTAFAIAFAWEIDGPLDREALRRALAWVVSRHEPLRSRFPAEDGQPWQQIDVSFVLEEGDGPDFAARRFDLAGGPLFRARLLTPGPDRHRLLLSFHHIIADGWSRGVFLDELAEGYRAFRAGAQPQRPDLPRHFADLVIAGQGWLDGPEAAEQAAFWRDELAGLAPQELCPGAAGDRRAATLLHGIDPMLAARVAPAAAALGVSPFVFLLAVFQLLLHRLTGSDDIAVGTPVAGRDSPETEAMIGLFLNTLVLRSRPQAGMRFRDWLDTVRRGFVRAFDNRQLPFAKVVEVSGAERHAGRTPLFQTLFQLQSGYGRQNAGTVDLGDPRLTVRQEVIPLPEAKFDLSWHMMEREGGLSVIIEYRAALFPPDYVPRMAAWFEVLLAAALDRPDAPVETLDFVPRSEAGPLSGPAGDIPCLLSMLTARLPGATLTTGTGETLPGTALLAEADLLARRLRARPELSGPDPRVAICLPRGKGLVVALLAALRAGIAYIPLDPAHPAARRAGILEDAEVGLMLAPDGTGAPCPVLDPATPGPDAPMGDLPAPDPDRIAYLIFTSGSTGRPKGVPVTQGALANLLAAMATRPGLAPGDRLLALTTVAFDIAALEILLPLFVGATLVLADAGTAAAPDLLAAALDRHAITHMQATPATWRLLVESGWQGDRRLVALCGGEALPSDLGHDLLARVGALWNMYGPTETTIWSAARRLDAADLTGPHARIGDPVANTTLLVLDSYCRPLPPGLAGELAIGGAGLSPGYWRRPDLTVSRFPARDGRLYLTGDRVRLEGDGTLTFLGRLDHQIKLNGHRIEPGEVEAALAALPGIAEAVVLAEAGRLVAWCRPAGADPAALRQALAPALPGYMIPTVFVMLDAFPLNPNGKIDRARLPRPEAASRRGATASTPAEQALLRIWSEVLGRADLGVEDNFFEMGGASVSAMRIAARARARGLVLTPAQMFEHQTISAQAAVAVPVAATLPLSPFQAARIAAPAPPRVLHIPLAPGHEARVTVTLAALRAAHPALRLGLSAEGWLPDRGGLWDWAVSDGALRITLHPLLLDTRSAVQLHDEIAAGLRGQPDPVARDGYAEWLTSAPVASVLPVPVGGDGPGDACEPVAQALDAGALRAAAQMLDVAPSRIVAAALARVLAQWNGGAVSLALVEEAPAEALGNYARVLPLCLPALPADPAASVRALRQAEAGCDPRGVDPRDLADAIAVLALADHPLPITPALSVEVRPDMTGLVWHFDATRFRRATVLRLSARLAAEITAPHGSGGSKLDRLRARLKESGR